MQEGSGKGIIPGYTGYVPKYGQGASKGEGIGKSPVKRIPGKVELVTVSRLSRICTLNCS